MTTDRGSILRRALALLSLRWVAMQIALGVLVFAMFVVWLRVPDSSAVSVVGSVLLGLLLLVLAGGGEAYLVRRLSGQPVKRDRILLGGVAILCGLALAAGWDGVLGHLAESHSLWAGYLNSRFPHGLRNTFSYAHLYLWLTWLWSLLSWLGYGFFAAVAVGILVGVPPLRAARDVLRSITFWILLLVGVGFADAVSGWIANWTPGHGLAVETLSLVVRMAALVVLDGLVASVLLAVAVAAAQRSNAEGGTPEESQPRTVDML